MTDRSHPQSGAPSSESEGSGLVRQGSVVLHVVLCWGKGGRTETLPLLIIYNLPKAGHLAKAQLHTVSPPSPLWL